MGVSDRHIGYVTIGSLRYGGIEADTYTVVFFDMWREEPVFHRFADDMKGREDDPTACGIPTWDGSRQLGTWMPTFHGARVGRPCRKCWPEWTHPLEDE